MDRYNAPFQLITIMKRLHETILITVAIIVLILLTGCTTTTEEKPFLGTERPLYIVGIDEDFPPFTYLDANGTPTGFDIDAVTWIAEKEGFDIIIKPIPWDSAINELHAGSIDLIYSGMSITDKRKELVAFSIPYWTTEEYIIVRKDSDKTIDDILSGKSTIGAERGSSVATWVTEHLIETGKMPDTDLLLFDSFPDALMNLKNEEIDAVITYNTSLVEEKKIEDQFTVIGTIDDAASYGVAVRKTDEKLLKTINDGLTKLMEDPYWEELKRKYEM